MAADVPPQSPREGGQGQEKRQMCEEERQLGLEARKVGEEERLSSEEEEWRAGPAEIPHSVVVWPGCFCGAGQDPVDGHASPPG